MRITYYGHSCFLIETSRARLLLDPFLTGNPAAKISPAEVPCDYILVSHGHSDHCADAVTLSKQHGATIISNYEISEYFLALGAKTHGMNPGGGFDFHFGRVKLTLAHHSSSNDDNPLVPVYLGNPCGLLLHVDNRVLYHAGDTALFLDMQLIGKAGLDLAFLPIGDNFTMGPEDALAAIDLLRPKLTVPMHYNTWPIIRQDAHAFAGKAAAAGHSVNVLAPGDTFQL